MKISIRFFLAGALSLLVGAVPFFLPVLAAGELREVRGARVERLTVPHRSDEIIVKFKGMERFSRVPVPVGTRVDTFLARFQGRGDVLYAEPNYIASAFFVPNDTYYNYQWHMDNDIHGGIHAETAWDISTGSGVTVAVVDTGIAYEDYSIYRKAPDLTNTLFVPGYNFVNNSTHANDDNGHGTHVAGTVAQSTNNSLGVAGVAFNAKLMPIKVLDRNGSGTYADVADGIRWAADNGAHVINLSLGGSASATYLQEAVAYAYGKGVVVVAASGNENGTVGYPAAYNDYVIAVGATRYDEQRAPYSNYGASLDVMAPGGDMNVDQNGDGYGDGVLQQTFSGNVKNFGYYFFQGTSMATPHIAGVAALVIANGNATTPDMVRDALQSTADDLGAAGRDDFYGWGLVNATAALNYAAGPVDNPPTVSLTAPASGSVASGTIALTADASDDNGVDRVDFYINNVLVGSDTTSPYEISWDSTAVADGNYTISVTAVDTASQTATDSVTFTVDNINDPPLANAGPDKSALVGESVSFDGSGSSDDSGIASYEWDFGDGASASGVFVSHSYAAAGTYTVTLTVTDDGGLTDTDTATVVVNEEPPVPTAYLSITMSTSGSFFWRANADVTALDADGNPIAGAAVTGTWSGVFSGTSTKNTNSSGIVRFTSDRTRTSGTATFTVLSMTKNGVSYELTGETSDSIAGGFKF